MNYQDYQDIRKFCGCKFKAQDLFPFDSFFLGIENQYIDFGESYFINAPCIMTKGNILRSCNSYFLWENDGEHTKMEFIEAYIKDDFVNLALRDMKVETYKVVKCPIPFSENGDVLWRIIDLKYLINQNSQLVHQQNNQNSGLLEFEY